MGRSFKERQIPIIDVMSSNPVQYEVRLIGIEDGVPVVIGGKRMRNVADAIASAWLTMASWARNDEPAWTNLESIRCGAVFETQDGVRAVKSEYAYSNGGACQCVLLASGEYAHFPDGNSTIVREIRVMQ